LNADNVVYDHGAVAVRNMQTAMSRANLFSQMAAEADGQEKTNITESMVQSEAGNLIVAGSDTTAVTLTYLVWAVLKHPQLQEQLEKEVAGLSNELAFEELKNAPILNSVIEETLRLYGAAPGSLPRVVPSKGATLSGHYLPAGTVVSTQAYTTHRDENVFPDATRYVINPRLTPLQTNLPDLTGIASWTSLASHLHKKQQCLRSVLDHGFVLECTWLGWS
jgi:cytochrome P450